MKPMSIFTRLLSIASAVPALWLAAGLAPPAHAQTHAQAAAPSPAPASVQASVQARAPIPVADFFRRPQMAQPRLSPSGRQIAMLARSSEGRVVLAVADVATPDKRVGVARFDDADVATFGWVNDRRLVFSAVDLQQPLGRQVGGGLYAVNADGSDFVWLIGRQDYDEAGAGHVANRPLRPNHVFLRTLPGPTDEVLVQRFQLRRSEAEPPSSSLLRLDTHTRAVRDLTPDAPDGAITWVLDPQQRPRAAITLGTEGKGRVMFRDPDRPWRALHDFDIYTPSPGQWAPVGFDAEGQLLARAVRNDDARTFGLFRFDASSGKLAEKPLIAAQGFDFEGQLVQADSGGRVLGAQFVTDAPGSVWFDERLRRLQEKVDKWLPATVNQLHCRRGCESARRLLVSAESDRQSPLYFLLDTEGQGPEALTLVGATRPWLDPARLAQTDFHRFRARDGRMIPVYVTQPAGKGPWPTVVLVHGGPWVRGKVWGFDPEAQFLATRGYLVVEPEFRGSLGFGFDHFKASWKQWGLTMQDDLTDATRWAVAQGWADARRLVIAGASYGGYATMMGLVKEPELYRAGINWVGVTDVDLMYSVSWSDASDLWLRQGMPALVGDRKADRAQLDATSPLKRASEIRRPVLMAYGTKDLRVPLPHGERMRDALKSTGKVEVEWLAYEGEGHGFLLETNLIDFWSRVEMFLARHVQ